MLVDGYPSYDYSSSDILPVDEMSIAIAVLLGVRSRATRTILFLTKAQFAKDVSNFESFLNEAIRAFEELRFQVIRDKQVCGLYSQEDLLPLDERSISIALLNNAKIRVELSIASPWGQSTLNAGQQETMNTASSAISAAIGILKNSPN